MNPQLHSFGVDTTTFFSDSGGNQKRKQNCDEKNSLAFTIENGFEFQVKYNSQITTENTPIESDKLHKCFYEQTTYVNVCQEWSKMGQGNALNG